MTKGLLRRISLTTGTLRGLSAFSMTIEYPITAIAGKNGAGKSTFLAMAACAFHAPASSYKSPRRKNAYYTFSDFFVQHPAEVPPQGLEIHYDIAYNNWRATPDLPNGVGIGTQSRHKSKGGKWNDYDTRVNRTVVFIGIERIVPHSERSQSKSYSRAFKDSPKKGWEDKVMATVGAILGKSYSDFRYVEHSKYNLPIVAVGQTIYSGLNMGAGENALFEIFSTAYSAGEGALLIIDEIELGLHAEAQRKFVEKLKDVSLELKIQVICTTHSKEIFDCLPSDSRFYMECIGNRTRITPEASSDFAFAKLSGSESCDMDILVEDTIAESIVRAALPASARSRVRFVVVGSASALSRQLAAAYIRNPSAPVLAVFDGDQANKMQANFGHAKSMAERVAADFEGWFKAHSICLPGKTWPEAWLLAEARQLADVIAPTFKTEEADFIEYLEYALQAGKHNEFHELGKHLGLTPDVCLSHICQKVCESPSDQILELIEMTANTLP
ncbi:ATP-dependent nuclease [Inhella crocodyli]|uniref:ATP-binding protein n=1 Tax=Inhella crocodyli TaxID=2499851 RepID=A0A437LH61_9BURK|nr:AAA family ATPase [Inhella crocodyli]RVT84722.1 ATP-binding protein [Inhella crocodyli]